MHDGSGKIFAQSSTFSLMSPIRLRSVTTTSMDNRRNMKGLWASKSRILTKSATFLQPSKGKIVTPVWIAWQPIPMRFDVMDKISAVGCLVLYNETMLGTSSMRGSVADERMVCSKIVAQVSVKLTAQIQTDTG